MPSGPGFELYQYVRTYGKCDQLNRQSCTPYSMAGYVAGLAIQQVGPGGLLSDLSTISSDLSLGDLISPLAQQLHQVLLFGQQIATLAANSILLNTVAKFLLLAIYTEISTTAPNPTQLVIPASDFVTSTQAPQTAQSSQTTGKLCPTQVPNCSNCGGNLIPPVNPVDTNGICVGLAKYGGFPQGCTCVNPNDAPPNAPYGAMEEIDEAVTFLGSVSANAINPTTTSTPINPTTTSTSTLCKNNGMKYYESGVCNEHCSGGKCTPIEMKVKRCFGCNNGPQIDYLCTCP